MWFLKDSKVKSHQELTLQEINAKMALVKDSIRDHEKALSFLKLSLSSLESEKKSRTQKGKSNGSSN